MSDRQKINLFHLVALTLIAALVVIAYTNSVDGKFLWDDEYLIQNNSYIKSPAFIPAAFTRDIGAGSGRVFGFYRPVQIVSYMFDYKLWALDPRGYHCINILLHILAAFSVYALIFTLFKNSMIALFTAAFFAVSPLNTASVAYISGRAESLYAIFTLLAFTLYIRSDKKMWLIGASALYAMALLSKEAALSLCLMIGVYHFAFKRPVRLKLIAPFLAITAVYVAWRIFLFSRGAFVGANIGPGALLSINDRLPGFFAAVSSYARLLFVPIGLHMEYGLRLFKLTDPRVLAGIILFTAVAASAVWLRPKNHILSFAGMWFVILLLPVSNIYPPLNAYMAEHWLYIPSIGAFIVAAYFIDFLYKNDRLRIVAIAILLATLSYYMYFTLQANRYWHDSIVFYERTLVYEPKSTRALNDLARKLDMLGRSDEALKLYQRAIDADPNYPLPYNNIGYIYHKNGRLELAEEFYRKALLLDTNYVDALNNLAVICQGSGRPDEALELYKKILAIHPNYAAMYNNIGLLYASTGRLTEARAAYMRAIELDPDSGNARHNLSLLSSYDRSAEASVSKPE